MNYNTNINNNPYQRVSPQIFLPSPQGIVYFINNSLEIVNVPINAGLSVVLCLPEECCYIKTIQNGEQVTLKYKLTPQEIKEKEEPEDTFASVLKNFDERLKNIEKSLNNKGGRLDELL